MFASYPLVIQILGWGVFMGLNGYISATCPGLNLAVLAFMGLFVNRKAGIALLVLAILITLAESAWFVATEWGVLNGDRKWGTSILNLILASITFFILLNHFKNSFPAPVWLSIIIVALFYIEGMVGGVIYWFPIISHGAALIAVGLLIALHYAALAPFAIAITTLVFLWVMTDLRIQVRLALQQILKL